MLYDAVVVGAGPAGSATARDIAREGFTVLVLEEHASVEWLRFAVFFLWSLGLILD